MYVYFASEYIENQLKYGIEGLGITRLYTSQIVTSEITVFGVSIIALNVQHKLYSLFSGEFTVPKKSKINMHPK